MQTTTNSAYSSSTGIRRRTSQSNPEPNIIQETKLNSNYSIVKTPQMQGNSSMSQHTNGASTMKALSYLIPFSLSWKRKSKAVVQDESPVKVDLRNIQNEVTSPEEDRYQYSLSTTQRQRLKPPDNNTNSSTGSPGKIVSTDPFNDKSISKGYAKQVQSISSSSKTNNVTETLPYGSSPVKQRSNSKIGVSSATASSLKNPRGSVNNISNKVNTLSNLQSFGSPSSKLSSVAPFEEPNELHYHYPGKTSTEVSLSLTNPSAITTTSSTGSKSLFRKRIQQVSQASEEFQLSPSRSNTQKQCSDNALSASPIREKIPSTVSSTMNSVEKLSKDGRTTSSLLSRFSTVTRDSAIIGAISGSSNADVTNSDAPITGCSTASVTSNEAAAATSSVPTKAPCCDKCDGKHETDDCPYYKKKRDDHPDAQRKNGKQIGGTSLLPGGYISNARVIRQPGDGSCLFHSLSFGLGGGYSASRLRNEICGFIQANPQLLISETPLKEWVKWDSGSSVSDYIRKMSRGSWGGGIEMACLSQMKQVNVHVYERSGVGFKRISAFDVPVNTESRPIIRVLYCGGVHYGK